jgi:hypothetical protein
MSRITNETLATGGDPHAIAIEELAREIANAYSRPGVDQWKYVPERERHTYRAAAARVIAMESKRWIPASEPPPVDPNRDSLGPLVSKPVLVTMGTANSRSYDLAVYHRGWEDDEPEHRVARWLTASSEQWTLTNIVAWRDIPEYRK